MIKIKTFVSRFGSNTYLLESDNYNYIIDPSVDLNILKQYLSDNEVKGILITHSHMDHIYKLEEYQSYFHVPIYISRYYQDIIKNFNNDSFFNMKMPKIKIDDKTLVLVKDGDIIDNRIMVIATPGHSKDSLCFLIEDKLFTGDTLFYENVGRWDLYSGNEEELKRSIIKLYSYNEKNTRDINIYPGHDRPSSLKNELIDNRFVRMIMEKENKNSCK